MKQDDEGRDEGAVHDQSDDRDREVGVAPPGLQVYRQRRQSTSDSLESRCRGQTYPLRVSQRSEK